MRDLERGVLNKCIWSDHVLMCLPVYPSLLMLFRSREATMSHILNQKDIPSISSRPRKAVLRLSWNRCVHSAKIILAGNSLDCIYGGIDCFDKEISLLNCTWCFPVLSTVRIICKRCLQNDCPPKVSPQAMLLCLDDSPSEPCLICYVQFQLCPRLYMYATEFLWAQNTLLWSLISHHLAWLLNITYTYHMISLLLHIKQQTLWFKFPYLVLSIYVTGIESFCQSLWLVVIVLIDTGRG